jgi:hypothetical protein
VALLLGAVGVAVEYAEVDAPRADGFAVLVGQEAGELVEVGKIVSGPGGEELREGDRAEDGVMAAASEILWLEIQGRESAEVFDAEERELVKQLAERLAVAFLCRGLAIEGRKELRFTVLQNPFCAREPVGAIAVDQVADDVMDGPGAGAFVLLRPGFGEIAE